MKRDKNLVIFDYEIDAKEWDHICYREWVRERDFNTNTSIMNNVLINDNQGRGKDTHVKHSKN